MPIILAAIKHADLRRYSRSAGIGAFLTIEEPLSKVTYRKSPAPMLKASANGAGIVITVLSPCLNVLTTQGFMYDFHQTRYMI